MNIRRQIQLFGAYLTLTLAGCDASIGNNDTEQTADPVVVDFPIAYIARPIPTDDDGAFISDDALDPSAFNPGARLIVKPRASVPANENVITEGLFPPIDGEEFALYDVKDVSVSPDGEKLLFALRAPEDPDADDENQPKWNIWEYVLETDDIYPIISETLFAEEGHDVQPYYLPNGKIVFTSDRQDRSKAVLLDENKPQFAALREESRNNQNETIFNLHTMDDDGSNIRQITFNQNQDLQPRVLDSGKIVFLRRDSYEGSNVHTSLYSINTNGSGLSLHYGYHSQNTGTANSAAIFSNPKLMEDGRLLVSLRSELSASFGGDMVLIDTNNFTDNTQASINTVSLAQNAQESITLGDVSTDGRLSQGGFYSSAHLINDETNRLLISWSPCVVRGLNIGTFVDDDLQLINDLGQFVDKSGTVILNPVTISEDEVVSLPCTSTALALSNIQVATPLYGIWVYDSATQTQSPVTLATSDTIFTDAVVFDVREQGLNSSPDNIDFDLADEKVGVVHIRSVYDIDGVDTTPNGISVMSDPAQTAVQDRPARFLRLIKAVSIPSEDVYDFDTDTIGIRGSTLGIKDIIGYVPIEPDGSAKFKVPADIAFSISILDAEGKKLGNNNGGRHRNWLSVREGETLECIGCHTSNSDLPHGRVDAQLPSANPGASDVVFPNTHISFTVSAQLGESMAEYYANVNGPRTPSLDLSFTDDWTDEALLPKAPSFNWSYNDLLSQTPPTSLNCLSNWEASCRSIINYTQHIQPMWEVERFNAGNDRTCTGCHDQNNFVVGANGEFNTQLELTATVSAVDPLFITSYVELLQADLLLELNPTTNTFLPLSGLVLDRDPDTTAVIYEEDGGVDAAGYPVPALGPVVCDADTQSIERLVLADSDDVSSSTVERIQYLTTRTLVYSNDPLADFVTDSLGDRIPLTQTEDCLTERILNAGSARNSQDFFDIFAIGGSHAGDLNNAELKLITEWLDIGGKYYNNPFEAPVN